MTALRIVMAQVNPLVGDVAGNCSLIIETAHRARDHYQADLVVFPELILTGYPPEDLLLRPGLQKRVDKALHRIKQQVTGITVVVGHPVGDVGKACYNAATVIAEGKQSCQYLKQKLPNYGVFDEVRYFHAGHLPVTFLVKGICVGLTICEDIWFTEPAAQSQDAGAQILLNLNASPYQQDKSVLREQAVRKRAVENSLPILYVNQVGGQDELIFDGASFAVDANGVVQVQASAFQTELVPVTISIEANAELAITGQIAKALPSLAKVYRGLVMGLKDYVNKNRFPGVVLGLSGGIDSALTLALAVDALGAERVQAVMMPSRYTSKISLDDAEEMAKTLNVNYSVLPIEPVFNQFLDSLKQSFAGRKVDTTEENIQARCRGILLMAISNKTGAMVLSTGNKSEMAVGYATLYGDMAGGFSPLKDVYKTQVFALSDYRNSVSQVIPARIISRPPSAELAEDQRDEDSLPPYSLLDQILMRYIEQDASFEDLVAAGFSSEIVAQVIKMVDRNEYKRRQAPPGIRISQRAFGRDRRYPITSGYTVTSAVE
ncbi:NAD synthetase / Glutamine amidotransferase chain of NAD synthetase [Methylophaga frappieri]|uniref:Glutamine-dependent NAD(+) synthetase n=1 Tax=Methylophaga frappieri (strain ATCC BAA-2434 / DSM 25690 / JAM7) TaxID=754477 RepID=I1YFC4_METFJ|nr:NAD+ synthase [Methylophaga frappieri]AFJ01617.1 NAD synthetase / Glutamine amidotransferase chain of NAD synthetase [Methylophaga frappieri]